MIWATVEIYCLRQVRHQVSESPNRFTGFPVFPCFDNYLPLFKHSFEARPLGSSSLAIFVCARWSSLVLLPVPVWLVLLRAAWAVSSTSRSFGKKMGFGWFWHALAITAANLKIYPTGAQNFSPHCNILPTSTTCSACFVTSRSPGALLGRF